MDVTESGTYSVLLSKASDYHHPLVLTIVVVIPIIDHSTS